MKNMEHFKKILILSTVLLFAGIIGLAQGQETTTPTTTTTTETTTPTPTVTTPSSVLSCIKTAVDKRETAIQAAFDVFSASIKSAFQTRKTELLSAWDISDKAQRQAAIRSAWNNFKKSHIQATQIYRKAKRATWKDFSIERRKCKGPATGENERSDMSL